MAALARIRDEGLNRSHVDSIGGYLTDVIGPRLTASSGLRRGQQWASQMFTSWGLANVAIEPWDSLFGRGWERVSAQGRIVAPANRSLHVASLGWSPSTPDGGVEADVVALETLVCVFVAVIRAPLITAWD